MPLRMLAIETSGRFGGVALAADGVPAWQRTFDAPFTHSRAVAPAVESGLRDLGWTARDVDVVAVSRGPGSYTGLRIGAACAKTFAYATGSRLVGVPTLDVTARNALDLAAPPSRVAPVVDARMGKVYTCAYAVRDKTVERETEYLVLPKDGPWEALPRPACVFGDGVPADDAALPAGLSRGDPALGAPALPRLVELGTQMAREGRFEDIHAFAPLYLRLSEAEEKRRAAGSGRRKGG